jgi:hypothetical protein
VTRIIPVLLLSSVVNAATLTPESVEAWDNYIAATKTNFANHTKDNATFLWVDESSDRRQRVRNGEIVIAETNSDPIKKAPSALIHDWTGAAFIPDAKIEAVIAVVRNYDHYKDYYSPTVISSRTVEKRGLRDRFSVVMINRSLLARTAEEIDCQAVYTQVSAKRWYAMLSSTQIQEIDDYARRGERRVPMGQGDGLLWRLASLTRFEERDGGVYLEVEALALSRDVPASLRFVVEPIVRRVSRNSLTESLQQTGRAVGEFVAGNLSAASAGSR